MTKVLYWFEKDYFKNISGRTKLRRKNEKLNQIYNFVFHEKTYSYLKFSKRFKDTVL